MARCASKAAGGRCHRQEQHLCDEDRREGRRSPFSVTKDNADSIKLVLEDIDKISDIADTDGDGDAVHEKYVVRDMYHHIFDITKKTLTAESAGERLCDIGSCDVQPVVFNGKMQGPKAVFNGEVLQEGVDYTWKAWGDNGSCTDPGEYDVMLFGKGRFAGNAQVRYAIEPAPEPSLEPEPEPKPQPSPVPTTKSKLSFDLAGGTLDGQTGTVVIEAEKGSVIDIPAAPTRDGYTSWSGSVKTPDGN